MPTSSASGPSTKLRKVTLYKNDLAYLQRSTEMASGELLSEGAARGFVLKVPNTERDLTMETISVSANGAADVVVSYDNGTRSGTRSAKAAAEDSLFSFDYGAGCSIGGFLASVVGADVACNLMDGSTVSGTLLSVSDERRAVPGSKDEVVAVFHELQVVEDDGTIQRVKLDDTRSVKMLEAHLHSQLTASLKRSLQRRRPAAPASDEATLRILAPERPKRGGGRRHAGLQPARRAAGVVRAAGGRVAGGVPSGGARPLADSRRRACVL